MNLDKLFSCQAKLDDRIVAEKGLQGVDLLDRKILALLTELGELSNEWQMFKFWKDNPVPNFYEEIECHACKGDAVFYVMGEREVCACCAGEGVEEVTNPLLEEYVDCLHFILSIGNDLDITEEETWYFDELSIASNITTRFLVIHNISLGIWGLDHSGVHGVAIINEYKSLMTEFMNLGSRLGFTTDQIEQAYYDKNEINHERQESGY